MATVSGRARVRMSAEEVAHFLGESMKVHVATLGSDGSPHLSTLFYVLHEGRIAFWTHATSQKIKNLQRNHRVSCLVEEGTDYFELRGVSISGLAKLVTDEEQVRRIGTSVAERMAGGEQLGDLGVAIVERQVPKRWAVVVEPTKVASWDHRKMRLKPGPDAR